MRRYMCTIRIVHFIIRSIKNGLNIQFVNFQDGSKIKGAKGENKKVPLKVLRYFPLKSILQRLFMSIETIVDMK